MSIRDSFHKYSSGRSLLAFSLLITVFLLALSPTVARADEGETTCMRYTVSVALAQGLPANNIVVGELCSTPSERQNGITIQLLVHGSTYNHAYWDFGTFPSGRYSYAQDVAARGFPTFAIDDIGAGQSTHPLSASVTLQAAGFVVHQVVQGLKNGSVTGIRFGKVIVMGHSGGSYVTWREAIDYHDADGLIITGDVHHLTAATETAAAQDFYAANQDPKFQSSGYDSGYLTTMPGTRVSLFYNRADADPNVIAADDNAIPFTTQTFDTEAGKDVFSSAEAAGIFQIAFTPDTQAIKVPVLIIMGSADTSYCGPDAAGKNFDCSSGTVIRQQEAPFYSPEAQLRACSISGSGHDISLHLNHAVQVTDAVAWSSRFVGQTNQDDQGQTNQDDQGQTTWPPVGCSS